MEKSTKLGDRKGVWICDCPNMYGWLVWGQFAGQASVRCLCVAEYLCYAYQSGQQAEEQYCFIEKNPTLHVKKNRRSSAQPLLLETLDLS